MRRIEVEFGIKIADVAPEELGPLLESLTRLAKNGAVQMSPETQRALHAVAPTSPLALPTRGNGRQWHSDRWKFTDASVTAALTAWQGNMAKAAKALGASPSGLYQYCHAHGIRADAFRAALTE